MYSSLLKAFLAFSVFLAFYIVLWALIFFFFQKSIILAFRVFQSPSRCSIHFILLRLLEYLWELWSLCIQCILSAIETFLLQFFDYSVLPYHQPMKDINLTKWTDHRTKCWIKKKYTKLTYSSLKRSKMLVNHWYTQIATKMLW